jgi:hypothetical protein
MPLHRWRRQHGSEMVARVEPGDDSRWIVSIWQGDTCVKTLRRRFQLLMDAHARADEALSELYAHECGASGCGEWQTERRARPIS